MAARYRGILSTLVPSMPLCKAMLETNTYRHPLNENFPEVIDYLKNRIQS
jgi:hypothetical protein